MIRVQVDRWNRGVVDNDADDEACVTMTRSLVPRRPGVITLQQHSGTCIYPGICIRVQGTDGKV